MNSRKITKGRLNRMMKYYRRYMVRLVYDHDSSYELGRRVVKLEGSILDYEVTTACTGFNLRIELNGGQQFDEFFEGCAYFSGVGEIIQYNGDGTYTKFQLSTTRISTSVIYEKIVSAAILLDRCIVSVEPPGRHHDILHNHSGSRLGEQGFLTSYGRFVDRKTALSIATEARQVIRRCGGDDKLLFSENLW